MDQNTNKEGESLTSEAAAMFIASLTSDMVQKVYSGKQGCMCGCLGKYSINPRHTAEAEKESGHDSPVGAGMRMVNKVLRLLQSHPNATLQDGRIVYVPREAGEERNYTLYLCKSARI